MNLLGKLFNFYINSSMHVALAVCALSYVTLLELGLTADWPLLCFVFFATITGYNFVKYFGLAKFHHRSLSKGLRSIQLFSLLCFLLMLLFSFYLSPEAFYALLFLGVVTFLYAVPFLPKRYFMDQQKNLRNIGGLKVYVIALVWAGVTVVLPVINEKVPFTWDIILTALQRFALVLMLILPFEIRDLRYDSLKLATIPQQIGVRNTKLMGLGFGILFFGLELVKHHTHLRFVWMNLTMTLITLAFVFGAKKDRSYFYSAFWVEGIPIFWLLLHLLVKMFL